MRLTPTLAAVPLLLLLLTWILVRSINTDAERFDRALTSLDDVAMVENALRRDILAARAGLLRDYDPLVREAAGLRDLLDRLREIADADAGIATRIDGLAATIARQEGLVERFKSDNALLQNSLAYFGLFSTRFGAADQDQALVADVGALAAAILHLTLDTSPNVIDDVEARLGDLAGRVSPSGSNEPLRELLAHARLLRQLLPATDDTIKALFALPAGPQLGVIRTTLTQRQVESRERAREYRLLLYGISVILLGLLAHLGFRLRAGALALRRRAAFEHLIAGISTQLITARREQTPQQIEQALAALAAHLGADRAYAVFGAPLHQRYVWSRDGIACPPGWPDQAAALSCRFRSTEDGVVHIPRVHRLPPGPDRETLAAAGLYGWACVSGRGDEGPHILGFDALQPSAMARAGELGLLRMAFDAIANAAGRDHQEQERSRLQERLQQARRMETIGALASGIAHNFNNIVGAILGYAEMAEAEAGRDGRPVRHLAQIRRAGERARDLVDQILAYGRRRPASRRPLKARALIAESASLLRASLPGTIELAVRQADDDALVSGEPAQLQQVILNLCNNAAQAMDGTGRIDIDVALQEVAAMRVLGHGTLMPGRYVRIAVVDTGRGMEPETLSHIFEPFFTMRADGNGLGLATVREIVREHGGMIDVWSRPGVGSRFEVWLPRAATGAASDGTDAAPLLGHGETVLMLYDDRKLLLRDEETVAALGYEPIGFTGAADALAACRAGPERFDVLMVSQGAAIEPALDLAAALHGAVPHLPILLAVASADRIDADALAAAGISDVVRRPLVSANLASVLKSAQSRKRRLTGVSA